MKRVYHKLEVSWSRFEDPGDYPSGAGGSALPDGKACPTEISGFSLWEASPEEMATLKDQFAAWSVVPRKVPLSEAGELVVAISEDISIDYRPSKLLGIDLHFFEKFVLVVPTHWEIDHDDYGGPNEKVTKYEIAEAVGLMERKGWA